MITRRALLVRYGSDESIARLLGMTANATRQWRLDRPIPDKHALLLCFCIDRVYWKFTALEYRQRFPALHGKRHRWVPARQRPASAAEGLSP